MPRVGASAGQKTAQGASSVFSTPAQPSPQIEPARAGSNAQDAPTPEQVKAIAHVQTCLAELGYYKGAVDGKRGRETWTAYWNFKHDHGLGGQSDLLAEKVRQKLDELCIETAAVEPPPAQPAEPAASDVAPQPEPATEQAVALDDGPHLDIDCLAEDLIALLRRAHGAGVVVDRCAPVMPAVAQAVSPQVQLDEMQAKNGVSWCRACVPIERPSCARRCAAHRARRQCRDLRHAAAAVASLRQRRGRPAEILYSDPRALPLACRPPKRTPTPSPSSSAIAITPCCRPSETSQNDAGAIYAFLTEHLGYRPRQHHRCRDAKKADLERLFGAEAGLDGELARLVETQPNAKVLVYYSGHGATDAAQTETYLLPVDSEPYREELGGYKLSTLYANLARLDARSVLVLLETDYGRDHGPLVLPPNLPETINTALPRAPVPALTVLAASDRGPAHADRRDLRYRPVHALSDRGAGRRTPISPPIGNGDGELDSAEIYAFTAAYVELAARKTFGLLQRPVYSSATTSVLTSARTASEARECTLRAGVAHCPDLRQSPCDRFVGGAGEKRFTLRSDFLRDEEARRRHRSRAATDNFNLVWE